MNIFTNLEQSKALKAAGFPQGKTERIHYQNPWNGDGYDCLRIIYAFPKENSDMKWWAKPSVGELMEELIKTFKGTDELRKVMERYLNWEKLDLLSTLVEAYLASNKEQS